MSYSQAWLDNTNNVRCILVVAKAYSIVGAAEVTFYLSNKGFITADALTVFTPVLIAGPTFSESISIDSNISISYGDLEISNVDGDYDDWLDSTKYVWANKQIQVYFGGPDFTSASAATLATEFDLVFDGLISDVDSRNKDVVNIKFRDKMEKLNTPVTENKLGAYGTWAGGQQNQDSIKPLIFGEAHNYEPLLVDPAQLQFMFNDGACEQLVEIRDNGVPIYTIVTLLGQAVVNNTTGMFTLTKPLVGTCTVSTQGVKKSINLTTGALTSTYTNTIANAIAVIVTQYGKTGFKLTTSELDLPNFSAFNTANSQSIGVVITDRVNVLNLARQILSGVGAQLFFTRKGKLQILQIGIPTSDPSVAIDSTNMVDNTFAISSRTPVLSSTKIGYAKNWLVQQNLTTSIPAQHKNLFEEEWLTTTVTDSSVASLYSQAAEPVMIETPLILTSEAVTEATRRNNFTKVARTFYSFTGTSSLLSLKLGQPVTVTYNRFGLDAGKSGQVTRLQPDFYKGTVQIEVLI